jgi:predicted ATPase/DNA-binding SARP family transcriptional activator/Flp pilus assembly protein TadD
MAEVLSLFGAPTIERAGTTRALDFERRTQLLVYLALKRAWVGRAEIAALLWPDQDTKLALTNLRKALHRLQSLPDADLVQSRGNALRCMAQTDVGAFESALAERRLQDALALRRGELLAGFDDDSNDAWSQWLGFERDRLRTAWRAAAQEHLHGDVAPADAVELALRLIDEDPLDEAALRLAMHWLARTGQVARARQAYRGFVARLADELGLTPSVELQALHDGLGGAAAAPAPTGAGAVSQPHADDRFIGRVVEVRRAASLLQQGDCRLLTITGPGGVGKTRLAQRVLHDCASSFADGATLVPLDDVTTSAEFSERLAREFDIALKGNVDPLAQVVGILRERHALIVLDNFEQLVEAAPMLARLLADCPRIKVVVTSRVRLGLAAEWLLPLTGLPVPEPEDAAELESFDAVRLFLASARRVEPAISAAAEAEAIVAIVRSVEGLPLALELAAAWTRVLSCRDIAAELERGAELLQSTGAEHPARHASVESVFDQSWRLLGERERQALARLSVFRGGFTPEAARAVGGVALPILAALVDKSLVRKDGARCFLHPLVQQFAHARLERHFDAPAAAAAHARHFLLRLAESSQRINHADPQVLRDIDAEFENVRAAWRFGVAHGPAEDFVRAAYGLMSYCDHRGRRLEGVELLHDALGKEEIEREPKFLAAIAAPAAWLSYRLDRYADAEALAGRAYRLQGKDDRHVDPVLTYRAATVLGATCMRTGRAEESERWLRRALKAAEAIGDPTNIAGALDNLGLVTRFRGDLDEALRLYGLALVRHREVGDAGGEASCLNNMGVVHILRRELDAAETLLDDARRVCERHGLPGTRSMVETNLANIAMLRNQPDKALRHGRQALELAHQTGRRGGAIDARHLLVWAHLHGGEPKVACAELVAAVTEALAIGHTEALVHGARLFAELLAARGAADVAARVMHFVLQQSPGLVARERAEAEVMMGAWSAGTPPQSWSGPPLDELARRIVAEANQAHTPLIAELRRTA